MKRSTLAAALVLLSLAGYVFWLERHPGDGDGLETVFEVSSDDITRIEIRRKNGEPESVILERDDGGWGITAPFATATDTREVDLLLDNIATMELTRTIPTESSSESSTEDVARLTEFGLDAPKLELRFTTGDGAEHGLRFGNDTLTPAHQYAARLDSRDVLVVASYLFNNFNKTVWDLRDKAIFRVSDDAEAKRISIVRGKETIELENDSGLWTLTAPRARADRFEATALVTRVRRAQKVDVIAESAADFEPYGLDAPTLVVRVELEDDAPSMELAVGRVAELDYYARVPSERQVFLVERGLVEDLQKDPAELRSKKLFEVPAFEVTRLEIGDRVIERTPGDDGNVWTEAGAELDEAVVQELLQKLTETEARDIIEEFPAFEPEIIITISTEETEEGISVSAVSGDTVTVQRNGEDVALTLAATTWSEISDLLSLEPKAEE